MGWEKMVLGNWFTILKKNKAGPYLILNIKVGPR